MFPCPLPHSLPITEWRETRTTARFADVCQNRLQVSLFPAWVDNHSVTIFLSYSVAFQFEHGLKKLYSCSLYIPLLNERNRHLQLLLCIFLNVTFSPQVSRPLCHQWPALLSDVVYSVAMVTWRTKMAARSVNVYLRLWQVSGHAKRQFSRSKNAQQKIWTKWQRMMDQLLSCYCQFGVNTFVAEY